MGSKLEDSIAFHEGFRSHPYLDSVGVPTIGYGCTRYPSGRAVTLADMPITEAEARGIMQLDILRAHLIACHYAWFSLLSPPRQDVVVEMLYNLGATRFDGFRHLHAALAVENYPEAAMQMADSKWAHQVHERAERLERQMLTGVYWNA